MTIKGNDLANVLNDTTDIDRILGFGGNDTLTSSNGTPFFPAVDSLFGGDGLDMIIFKDLSYSGWAYGGNGDDTIRSLSGCGAIAFGGSGNDFLQLGATSAGADLYGGDGSDTLDAGCEYSFLMGGAGNDVLYGAAHSEVHGGRDDDLMFGAANTTNMHGDDGNDTMTGTALRGDDGNDLLTLLPDGPKIHFSRYANGGKGNDTIQGSSSGDYIQDDYGNNLLFGGDGQDVVASGFGTDTIYGGNGFDGINSSGNNVRLFGEAGNDRIMLSYGNGSLFGGAGNDTIQSSDVTIGSKIYGGTGDDLLANLSSLGFDQDGNTGTVWMGGDGNDSISGTRGSDTIYGGAGSDRIFGNIGSDAIYGGTGDDTLIGYYPDIDEPDAANTFIFRFLREIGTSRSGDTILQFRGGIDKIDMSAIGGLSFVNDQPFSNTAGEVRFDMSLMQVQIDVNGDGVIDATLRGFVSALAADDFIL